MRKQLTVLLFLWIVAVFPARTAFSQLCQPGDSPPAESAAGAAAPAAAAAPTALPPVGSPPFVWILQPCFNSQGGSSTIENETYMYYIQLRPSTPSQKTFIWYDQATEQTMLSDFKRLWATNFLDDLSIEVTDQTFAN